MLKLSLALTLTLLLVHSVGEHRSFTRKQPDTQLNELTGPVQTVRIETASFSNATGEWVEIDRMLSGVQSFDPNGNLSDSYWYRSGGTYKRELFNDPGANGQYIEQLIYNAYDGHPHFMERWVHHYDSVGNRIEQDHYYTSGKLGARWLYSYGEGGKEVESAFCNPDGSIISRDIHKYDSAGRLLETAKYKADGYFECRWEYSYDEDGRLVRDDFYDHENKLFGRDVYTYKFDSAGNWTKQIMARWLWYYKATEPEPSSVTYRFITYY
jgi:hypothetical protein